MIIRDHPDPPSPATLRRRKRSIRCSTLAPLLRSSNAHTRGPAPAQVANDAALVAMPRARDASRRETRAPATRHFNPPHRGCDMSRLFSLQHALRVPAAQHDDHRRARQGAPEVPANLQVEDFRPVRERRRVARRNTSRSASACTNSTRTGRPSANCRHLYAALQLRSELDPALGSKCVCASMRSGRGHAGQRRAGDEPARREPVRTDQRVVPASRDPRRSAPTRCAASSQRSRSSLAQDGARGPAALRPAHAPAPARKRSPRAGRPRGAGGNIRGVFANAEMKWPTVKLSDGKEVTLDAAAYTQAPPAPEA